MSVLCKHFAAPRTAGLNLHRKQWLLREKLRFTVVRLSEQPSIMEANYRSWSFLWTAHYTATITEHPKVNKEGLEPEVDNEQEPIDPPHKVDVYVSSQLRTCHRLRLCCSSSNIRHPLCPPIRLVHTAIIQAPNLRAYCTFAFLC